MENPLGRKFEPADLDGKTLVFIRRNGRGYDAEASGKMRAVGDVIFLETIEGSFPLSEFNRPFLEPVFPSNRLPACQGFDFFTVRR